jgi:hypothetical protein
LTSSEPPMNKKEVRQIINKSNNKKWTPRFNSRSYSHLTYNNACCFCNIYTASRIFDFVLDNPPIDYIGMFFLLDRGYIFLLDFDE